MVDDLRDDRWRVIETDDIEMVKFTLVSYRC